MGKCSISVIVPVYNSHETLNACVESVLAQSFVDFEVIIVDDGSTDGSGELCDSFAIRDHRVTTIHQQNLGVSSARNAAMSIANGDWITFVDSDDVLLPSALQIYSDAISSEVDIVKAGYLRINRESGDVDKVSSPYLICDNLSEAFLYCQRTKYRGFLWNTLVRSSIAKQFCFDETITWCEDAVFVFSCFSVSRRIVFLDQVVYGYYYQDSSIVSSNLSNKLISPDAIVKAAIMERDIISKFIGSNEDARKECEGIFDYMINYAVTNSLLLKQYIAAAKILITYSSSIIGSCRKAVSAVLHKYSK